MERPELSPPPNDATRPGELRGFETRFGGYRAMGLIKDGLSAELPPGFSERGGA